MLANLAAIFVGIKNILDVVNNIVAASKVIANFIQDNKDQAWFQESAKVFKEIRDANTPELRKAAAKKLRDSWRNL